MALRRCQVEPGFSTRHGPAPPPELAESRPLGSPGRSLRPDGGCSAQQSSSRLTTGPPDEPGSRARARCFGDTAATRPSETALNTCNETQRDAQPSSTWIRQCEDGEADSRCAVGRPIDACRSPVSTPMTAMSPSTSSPDPTGRRVPVGECAMTSSPRTWAFVST